MKKGLCCFILCLALSFSLIWASEFDRQNGGDFSTPPDDYLFTDGTPEDVVVASSRPANDISVGDLDGDGDPDIVLALPQTAQAGRLLVLKNRGRFQFDVLDSAVLGLTPQGFNGEISACKISDLNQDGYPDIIAAKYYDPQSRHIWVFINDMANSGSLDFELCTTHGIAPITCVAAIDAVSYDGNRYPDLLINALNGGQTALYQHIYNDESGFPHYQEPAWSGFELGEFSFNTCPVDLMGDGYDSLFMASGSIDAFFAEPNPIFWSDGSNVFLKYEYEGFGDPIMRTFKILPLDLDLNGLTDHLYYLNSFVIPGMNSENRLFKILRPMPLEGGEWPDPHPVLAPRIGLGLDLKGDDECGRFGDFLQNDHYFLNDFIRASGHFEPVS